MHKAPKNMRPSKESLEEIPELDLSKAKVIGRGLRKDRRLPLRALREGAGKTQSEVARLAEMDQSEISRVEQRDDMKLSTLRRYARALGADIEITAVLENGIRRSPPYSENFAFPVASHHSLYRRCAFDRSALARSS